MLEDNQKEKVNSWKERELGAFWTQDSKKGKYLSGSVDLAKLQGDGKMRVVMFPNSNKESDNQPDYILYVSKDTQPQSNSGAVKKAEIPETLV